MDTMQTLSVTVFLPVIAAIISKKAHRTIAAGGYSRLSPTSYTCMPAGRIYILTIFGRFNLWKMPVRSGILYIFRDFCWTNEKKDV